MIKPRVIVADVDNTIVPKHQQLSQRTIKALIEIRKKGIYFGIASGRPKNELRMLLDKWKDLGVENDLVIASNGCVLIDNISGKEYEYYFMTPEQIKASIELMKPFATNPTTSIDGVSWSGFYDEFVKFSEEYIGSPVKICESDDYHELWQKPVGKMMFRLLEPEKMQEIEEYVAKNCPEGLSGFKTNPMAFEFTDSRANKGIALENFCKLHDIDISESWAFGDTSNDNQMLEKAGTGICLLNGTDDTKACADLITEFDVEHDGFARFLEKHLF